MSVLKIVSLDCEVTLKILVAIPTSPALCPLLKAKAHELAARLPDANPGHELTIIHDYRKVEALPTDITAWSRVTRARQAFVDAFDVSRFDQVLWIDADIVEYPADLPTRLVRVNPEGIAAPMVFIEGQPERFYDFAAFVELGKSHIEPSNPKQIPGRNLSHDAPYWSKELMERIVSMDSVGTIVMVNAQILTGHNWQDHPAFTDWFSLCQRAKKVWGDRGVLVDRDLHCLHADLGSGKYEGTSWH